MSINSDVPSTWRTKEHAPYVLILSADQLNLSCYVCRVLTVTVHIQLYI